MQMRPWMRWGGDSARGGPRCLHFAIGVLLCAGPGSGCKKEPEVGTDAYFEKFLGTQLAGAVEVAANLMTVVMASNVRCAHGAASLKAVRAIVRRHPKEVRVLFMHSLTRLDRDADRATVAAQAAGQQGKFWEYQALLFKHPGELNKQQLIHRAIDASLDQDRFKKDLDNRRMKSLTTQDQQQLRRLGARTTPMFFVNGVYRHGPGAIAQLEALVVQELKYARELLRYGVKQKNIYRRLMRKALHRIPGKPHRR